MKYLVSLKKSKKNHSAVNSVFTLKADKKELTCGKEEGPSGQLRGSAYQWVHPHPEA